MAVMWPILDSSKFSTIVYVRLDQNWGSLGHEYAEWVAISEMVVEAAILKFFKRNIPPDIHPIQQLLDISARWILRNAKIVPFQYPICPP